jgi:hypothetical protein
VRFLFNSVDSLFVDSLFNDTTGWHVDDVQAQG